MSVDEFGHGTAGKHREVRPLTMTPETENNAVAVPYDAQKRYPWDDWTGGKGKESDIIGKSADLEGK